LKEAGGGEGEEKGWEGQCVYRYHYEHAAPASSPPISLFLAQQHNAFCLRNVCGERGGDENRNGNKEFTL